MCNRPPGGIHPGRAPRDTRLPASTDEALVAGIVGLVGDHLRVGRLDRLAELRPELVLLTLLPYLGFTEAQRWANQVASARAEELDNWSVYVLIKRPYW